MTNLILTHLCMMEVFHVGPFPTDEREPERDPPIIPVTQNHDQLPMPYLVDLGHQMCKGMDLVQRSTPTVLEFWLQSPATQYVVFLTQSCWLHHTSFQSSTCNLD